LASAHAPSIGVALMHVKVSVALRFRMCTESVIMANPATDTLVTALLKRECYPHAVAEVELHETHISSVFLAGPYAYKVKKPVALGFLDFSTLDKRRHYCEEELRLNRRFAPELYLDVVEIRGSRDAPRIGGTGPLVEWALRMQRFPQEALASGLLERGELTPNLVTDFAIYLAHFHSSLPPAPRDTHYGTPDSIRQNALQNFDQISPLLDRREDAEMLRVLRDWTERELASRTCELGARRSAGMVRECHGDLHLRNIVAINGRLVPFDCLEFSPELRWNDVMSEVAFLVMDLMDHGALPLAWAFLNAYVEATGGYSSLAVLRFYLVYRAVVRAKIDLLRARQPALPAGDASRLMGAYRGYIDLATRCATQVNPALILMHGLSGSGKSTIAAGLVPALGAIRIRSDVERKRLQGLPPLARTGSEVARGAYEVRATEDTYTRLAEAARDVAAAGYAAIVDATFLKRSQRAKLTQVALGLGVPITVVDVHAPTDVLRSRIALRSGDPSEATVQVLEHQIATAEPICASEQLPVIAVDTAADSSAHLVRDVAARLAASDRACPPVDSHCQPKRRM
jgi:aminoglycoside phosphotransferase family enzyme/predicted kinase